MSNFIGVDNFAYAIMTSDTVSGCTYLAPKTVPGIVKISVDTASGRTPFYADNGVQEYAQVPGEIKVAIELGTLPLSVQADFLGHTLSNGQIVRNKNDKAPYVAIFYRRKKSNGSYRYKKVLKCLFGYFKDDAETIAATPKVQTDTLDAVAMPRIFDGNWDKSADQDETGYVDVSSTWFTAVDTSDSTAPTVSSTTPAAGATSVATTATYQWVFSKNLSPATVNTNNFYLIKDTDGSIVSATVAYNDSAKTVTLTPTSSLTSVTKYIAVADSDVADLSGNHLTMVSRTFTCA